MSMRKLKRLVTLVTKAQAIKGSRFSIRVHRLCKKCKLYKACVGKLRSGLTYEIVKIRGVTHECPLVKSKMVVVEVVEAPKLVCLTSKVITKGLVLTYRSTRCREYNCPYYKYCAVEGFNDGEKIVVEEVLNKPVNCPKRLNVRLALVRRLAAFEELS